MKKIIICAAVVAAAVFGVMKATDVNVNNGLSDLQMENIEVLAQQSEPDNKYYKYVEPGTHVPCCCMSPGGENLCCY